MIIYAVVTTYSHAEPDVELFTSADDAITYARTTAQRNARNYLDPYPVDDTLTEQQHRQGILYYARYSPRNTIRVITKRIRPKTGKTP